MDTNQICERIGPPLNGWQRLDTKPVGPPCAGIYVIRVAGGVPFGRFKGESDVVYIGCCGDLEKRPQHHYRVRPDGRDKGALLAILGKERKLEIGFFPCSKYKERECDLLNQYLDNHLELPPANWRLESSEEHQKVRTAEAAFASLSVEEQQKLLDTLLRGVPTRECQKVLPEMPETIGISRSSVSREAQESRKAEQHAVSRPPVKHE